MKLALIVLSAVLLERLLGHTQRWQLPWVGFKWLARQAEAYCYGPQHLPTWIRFTIGGLVLIALVSPIAFVSGMLCNIPYVGDMTAAGLLALTIRMAGVRVQAQGISQALQERDLARARQRLKSWVAYDTDQLDETGCSVATLENLLERSHDKLFGVIFWFVIAGPPGAVVFGLTLSLAGRWGYPTPRYRYFGWITARLAALLRWLPSQLTAFGFSLAGDRETARRCWNRQSLAWPSPSAGALIATGAGALRLQLGGPVKYFGRLVIRPALGEGILPDQRDISRALKLVDHSLGIWLGVLIIESWLYS